MRSYFIAVLLLLTMVSCAQDKQPILGETEFQKEMNAYYKDATTSPLKDKDRKRFKGLDFFKFDSAFVVQATFKRTPDEKVFQMKTTGDRLPEYIKYGEITFQLLGKDCKLNVYQNQEYMKTEAYDNDLFLPFLDDTNGEDSYGGGRYINLKIPEGNTFEIDFNTAYNPYCAYNDKYSCPVVPRENYLPLEVKAGVKAFEKH